MTSEILSAIKTIVGPQGLLTGADVTSRPLNWLGAGKREARAIVRPQTTQHVSDVMKICHKAGVKVVPLGGLTGLVHGTDSAPEDIVLSLERMNAVETIDTVGMTALVQAGAPLQKVHDSVEKAGLYFPLDLGARGSCTIGGNIATNAGGNQVIRYGMMREQVLGLEAVLADGTIVSSLNALLKNNTGYDLKHLFIGSEGTLGIVTRAVLRLRPKPVSQNTALVSISGFENLTKFFALMGEQLAGGLTSFEVMWHSHYHLLTEQSRRHTPPLPNGADYYVIIEQQGAHPRRDSEQFTHALEIAAENTLIDDAVLAQSETQAKNIWKIREDIEGLAMAMMPGAVFDISLPIVHMQDYLDGLETSLVDIWADKARLVVFGHMGDCNLHLIVSVGDGTEATIQAINKCVYDPLADFGGSISAEHGIGLEKKAYLHLSRRPEEVRIMQMLKTALDPDNILNPGKIL